MVNQWISENTIFIMFGAGSYLFQVAQRILFNLLPKVDAKKVLAASID